MAQGTIKGMCKDGNGMGLPCKVWAFGSTDTVKSTQHGEFSIYVPDSGNQVLWAWNYFQDSICKVVETTNSKTVRVNMVFLTSKTIDEVVVSGTLLPVSKGNSPVAVETFRSSFFRKNISPNLFESVGMINGIRPQLNCNVCNTGDIHMNGMEGPYTLILIDGMPVISSLASVYGLSGIPSSLLEKVEIVRGPASSLYGSESMGGLINVITKNPSQLPFITAEITRTSWSETNTDIAVTKRFKRVDALFSLNHFYYMQPRDLNHDGFTDVALQNRISLFQKTNIRRNNGKPLWFSARYSYESRWGGQMNWAPIWRGTDSIYGESIYSHHAEFIGMYHLNTKGQNRLQWSLSYHNQNSVYGKTPFLANQTTGFLQWVKTQKFRNIQLLFGSGLRYTRYDDNTVATADSGGKANKPQTTPLPGIFVQAESAQNRKTQVLIGYRMDYHPQHKFINSPRMAVKINIRKNQFLRVQSGTGFRVVNLFTEDHAALTGDRKVIVAEKLLPEKSWSTNVQYTHNVNHKHLYAENEISIYYTRFSNKIIGDYATDPNAIIFANLRGYAVSQGVSMNSNWRFSIPLTISAGWSYAHVFRKENQEIIQQWFAPKWSGNFTLGYTIIRWRLTFNITSMINGPMRLPVQINDFRPEYSPWYQLLNCQMSQPITKKITWHLGVKNVLNFVPTSPLIRPFDPFDKTISDPVNNPNHYTFDTSYNYASLQGRRSYFGIRWTW